LAFFGVFLISIIGNKKTRQLLCYDSATTTVPRVYQIRWLIHCQLFFTPCFVWLYIGIKKWVTKSIY